MNDMTTSPVGSSSRTIFLDVDGTLVGSAHSVAPSVGLAVSEARRNGHLVFLCTGRAPIDIHPQLRDIEFDGAITNGGSHIVSDGRELFVCTMPAADMQRAVAFCIETATPYFLQSHDQLFASRDLLEMLRARLAEDGTRPPDLSGILDASTADLSRQAKLVFAGGSTGTLAHAARVLGPGIQVVPGSINFTAGEDGELIPAGVTKGSAIVRLLEHLGRSASHAIGIGDSWNDIEMFQTVGHAVAMGNAHPDIQALAAHVTTHVDEDGVWNAFVELGLVDRDRSHDLM